MARRRPRAAPSENLHPHVLNGATDVSHDWLKDAAQARAKAGELHHLASVNAFFDDIQHYKYIKCDDADSVAAPR